MSNQDDTINATNIPEDRAEEIDKELQRHNRKQVLMTAQLTTLAPSSLLFNAISVASTELARLNRLSSQGELGFQDFKIYHLLISALTKLSEEQRLLSAQSHLNSLTEQQKLAKVREALAALEALND